VLGRSATGKKKGSYKYKNVGTVDDVMLTCSLIKLIDVPLCISHVVVCIQTSSV
jgi:hypothetical protein